MGRQFRGLRRGAGSNSGLAAPVHQFVGPTIVTSSSVVAVIPNYGVTDISTWAAGEYVMDAPEQGVMKMLVSTSTTTLARIIRLSTGTQTVSVNSNPVTTGASGNTQITFNGTADQVMTLMGYNSTHWLLVGTNVVMHATGMAIAST